VGSRKWQAGRNGWRRGFNLALGLDGMGQDWGWFGLDWIGLDGKRQHVVYPRLESGGLFTITGIFVSLLAEV